MSIFCHPDVMTSTSVRAMLGIESEATPDFGFKPRTPLHNGKRDNTEIDMKLDQLLVEAKADRVGFPVGEVQSHFPIPGSGSCV
jgi:hypothetical protein